MSEPVNKQRGTPPNPAHMDGDILSKMLEAMSVEELTDALWNELENTTEENYDPEWIDAAQRYYGSIWSQNAHFRLRHTGDANQQYS